MKHHRHPFTLIVCAATLAVLTFSAPPPLQARLVPVADFPAPMSPEQAQARVAAAQADDTKRRAARTLKPVEASALPQVQTLYLAQSGYHLSDRTGFLRFWRENGGELIFGYPISEEIVEDGQVVQYFERARFEYHPERSEAQGRVLLSRLGSELTEGRDFPTVGPDAGELFFPETGHSISGVFKDFWQKRGGLPIFGYPISEPLEEVSPDDGQTYTVQYFERARFEHRPGELDTFYRQNARALGLRLAALHEVRLGKLGQQAALRHSHRFGQSTRHPGAQDWSPDLWERRIDIDITKQLLTAYEGETQVYQAPVATGKDGFNTPTGTFAIYSRIPIQTMVGEGGGESWYVPDIPWVQYVVGGVALHGTYWHDQWGTGYRLSHGCINLNIDDAQWLYEWADIGTTVEIHH
ncbi:MAG TPA: L,D-transpeptidase [Roseiflexaceae bacterium]|nr:L,D-transpeptidase [Roseiflexaceae bacterium]